MHDVFISYSTQDKPIADAICAGLEQNGIRCWIAPRDILAGREWGHAIVEAISAARVMVLLLSASANKSPQIPKEVDRAVHKGLTIIPLRIEDVQPAGALEYYLGPAHWLDAINPPMQAHIDRLAQNIKALIAAVAIASPADTAAVASSGKPLAAPIDVPPPPPGREAARPQDVAPPPPPLNSAKGSSTVGAAAPPPLHKQTGPSINPSPPRPPLQSSAYVPPPGSSTTPTDSSTAVLFYVLAAIVPLAGVILWLMNKDKPFPQDRRIATTALVIGLGSLLAYSFLGCLCLAAAADSGY